MKEKFSSSGKERRLESTCDSHENLLFMNMIFSQGGDMKVAARFRISWIPNTCVVCGKPFDCLLYHQSLPFLSC